MSFTGNPLLLPKHFISTPCWYRATSIESWCPYLSGLLKPKQKVIAMFLIWRYPLSLCCSDWWCHQDHFVFPYGCHCWVGPLHEGACYEVEVVQNLVTVPSSHESYCVSIDVSNDEVHGSSSPEGPDRDLWHWESQGLHQSVKCCANILGEGRYGDILSLTVQFYSTYLCVR